MPGVMTGVPFEFPSLPGMTERPRWTGRAFRVGGAERRILAYEIGATGWSEELTRLHEQSAAERHFIDVASRAYALETIRRHITARQPAILEIGCSSGYLLRELAAAFPEALVMGADHTLASLEALAERLPAVPLLRFDATRCPLPDAALDVVVMLNVLEHIERDDLALAHAARILKPGGVLVLEVPAGPRLYGGYDRQLMHCRRYDMAGLERLTAAAGLRTRAKSHLGFLLYPAFWLAKTLTRSAAPGAASKAGSTVARSIALTGRVNRLGYGLMGLEGRLRRVLPMPFGIRCLLCGVKPSAS